MKQYRLFSELKKNYKKVEPKSSWVKSTREDVLYFARTNIPIKTERKFRLAYLTISMLIFILIIPISAVIASKSNPGDYMYPMKRFIEEIHVAATFDKEEKRILMEDYISKRLKELLYVFEKGDKQSQDIAIKETQEAVQNIMQLDTVEDNTDLIGMVIESLTIIEDRITGERELEKISNLKNVFLGELNENVADSENVQGAKDSQPEFTPMLQSTSFSQPFLAIVDDLDNSTEDVQDEKIDEFVENVNDEGQFQKEDDEGDIDGVISDNYENDEDNENDKDSGQDKKDKESIENDKGNKNKRVKRRERPQRSEKDRPSHPSHPPHPSK